MCCAPAQHKQGRDLQALAPPPPDRAPRQPAASPRSGRAQQARPASFSTSPPEQPPGRGHGQRRQPVYTREPAASGGLCRRRRRRRSRACWPLPVQRCRLRPRRRAPVRASSRMPTCCAPKRATCFWMTRTTGEAERLDAAGCARGRPAGRQDCCMRPGLLPPPIVPVPSARYLCVPAPQGAPSRKHCGGARAQPRRGRPDFTDINSYLAWQRRPFSYAGGPELGALAAVVGQPITVWTRAQVGDSLRQLFLCAPPHVPAQLVRPRSPAASPEPPPQARPNPESRMAC